MVQHVQIQVELDSLLPWLFSAAWCYHQEGEHREAPVGVRKNGQQVRDPRLHARQPYRPKHESIGHLPNAEKLFVILQPNFLDSITSGDRRSFDP